MLKIFKRKDIDDILWNDVINRAENGVIYALTFFLDQAAHPWEAIINYDTSSVNPYKSIMPIIFDKKYGIRYIAYEPWCAMLGIFTQGKLDNDEAKNMIEMARKNHAKVNRYPFEPSLYNCIAKAVELRNLKKVQLNYFDLSASYAELRKAYNRNRARVLSKARADDLIAIQTNDINKHIELFKAFTYPKIAGMKLSQLDQLDKVYRALAERGFVKIYEIKKDKHTLSSGLFFLFKNTITYFTCTNTTLGYRLNSQSLLLDYFLKNYSGSAYTLEAFSGTHEGVGYFYESFGAKKKNIPVWHDQQLKLQNVLFRG